MISSIQKGKLAVNDFVIRKIESGDNASIAHTIRTVMTDIGAVGPGFSIQDAEVDAMYEAYHRPESVYYVVCINGQVCGGGGIGPLTGGAADTCELKKMYFQPQVRGLGAGRVLANLLLHEARKLGYGRVYIETLACLTAANQLYGSLGFQRIDGSLGATGHNGCNTFYLLEFDELDEIVIGE